jgi:hypothetical protein
MIYLPKERAPMPITKARLNRMIDMIDSAWLKRRDSENTNPKQFFESPSVRNPPISDSPPEKIHDEGKQDQVASPWGEKPKVPIPIEHI